MSNGADYNHPNSETILGTRLCQTVGARRESDTDALQFMPTSTQQVRHLYVHIPFCARICPYCAFYKDLLDRSQTARFCDALLRELQLYHGGAVGPPTRSEER